MAVLISDSILIPDTAKNAQHPKGNSLIEKELLMIAQGRTLKLLRLAGIVGIITGMDMGWRQLGPFMAVLPALR
jgi:hypothetical protein